MFDTIFTLLYVRHYYAKLGLASRKAFSDAVTSTDPAGDKSEIQDYSDALRALTTSAPQLFLIWTQYR